VSLLAGVRASLTCPRSGLGQDALLQRGCGVGHYLFGQVGVVDCPGHGDRADKDTEGEDRVAFSGLAVGIAGEVSHHGQAFLALARIL
jgi:hypothetical protein